MSCPVWRFSPCEVSCPVPFLISTAMIMIMSCYIPLVPLKALYINLTFLFSISRRGWEGYSRKKCLRLKLSILSPIVHIDDSCLKADPTLFPPVYWRHKTRAIIPGRIFGLFIARRQTLWYTTCLPTVLLLRGPDQVCWRTYSCWRPSPLKA